MSMSYAEFLKYTLQRGPTWKGGVSFQKWFRASMLWRRSAIAAWMLNSSAFALSLTHSLVPERGTGSPTFTRATTATGQKWDEAGYLDFTALAGEVVFKGARRERNLLTFTEDFSNAAWTKYRAPVMTYSQPAPDGTNTATKIAPTAVGGTNAGVYASAVTATGRTLVTSFYVKPSNWTWIQINKHDGNNGVWFNLVAGTVGTQSAGTTGAIEALDDGWFRCSILSASAATSYSEIAVVDGDNTTTTTGNSVDGIFVWHPQLEDVTGQADQTASEYVSVGVESAPAYHGSMVDGVKCYDTDRSGNPISTTGSYPLVGYVPWEARTNLCLQSNAFTTTWTNNGTPSATQNAVGPDGATSAWTLTDDSAVVAEGIYQSITLTAAVYTMSVFVKKTTGAQSSYPVIYANTGSTIALATIDTSNGVATCWTAFTGMTILSAAAARCSSYNSNFWRVELSYTATAAAYVHFLLPAATTNSTQSTGTLDLTAQGSAVFYGAQVELGSFATPYIPTTTLAVARNADLLTYTGADVANIKTLAATFSRGVGVNNVGAIAAISDGTTANYLMPYLNSETQLRFNAVAGGVGQGDLVADTAYVSGTTYKLAMVSALNASKRDVNGTAQAEDTTYTVPATSQINVGHLVGNFVLNGPVNHIYGWTRPLSQSELGAIDA